MQKSARQQDIIAILKKKQCSGVREICEMIYASPATVRRDLREMEKQGLVRTFYGGVTLAIDEGREIPISVREQEGKAAKQAIARAAAQIIPAGATVMLDASSTAMYMADYLNPEKNITVFTNGLHTANALCQKRIRTYCLGGEVGAVSMMTTGSLAELTLSIINVDMLFFSSQGMDWQGMISDNSERESRLRREMLRHARKSYFLCGSEKIGLQRLYKVCDAADLTGIFSNRDISQISGINAIMV